MTNVKEIRYESTYAVPKTRKIKGHWEIDTVMGKGSKHCIVTIVERKTGYTIIGQLNESTTKSTNKRTIKLLSKMSEQIKTITSDNGTEFHQYKVIEQATGCSYYFANSHHSRERGINENTNGLIRQYLVKGTSMNNYFCRISNLKLSRSLL